MLVRATDIRARAPGSGGSGSGSSGSGSSGSSSSRNQGFIRATAARRISFEDSLRFERIHEQAYRELGFQLAEVPPGPLADRVALIRQTVGRLRGDG